MKKYICDKCKKEFSKNILEECGYDICKSCHNKFISVVRDFFIEEESEDKGSNIITRIFTREDIDTPAYLRKKKTNK
jgi:hypothetical protein